jgi:acyl carrier protein
LLKHRMPETNYIVVAAIAVAVVASLAMHFSIRRRASRVVNGRSPLSEKQFAALFQTERERALAPAVRDQLRRYIPVDPALVLPDDRLCQDLQLAAVDGLDANAFVLDVEKFAGVKIPEQDAARMLTLRDIISYVAARTGERAK